MAKVESKNELGNQNFYIMQTFSYFKNLFFMAQSSFFQRFGWHLPYWAVIMGLAGWIVWGNVDHKGNWLDEVSIETLRNAHASIQNQSLLQRYEIQKNAMEYPNLKHIQLDSFSERTIQMVEGFQGLIQNLVLEPVSGETQQKFLTSKQADTLLQKAIALQDSLLLLGDRDDPFLKKSMPDLLLGLPQNQIGEFLTGSKNDFLLLTLQNIQARAEICKSSLLTFFSNQMGRPLHSGCSSFQPAVSVENPAPKIGELYIADIFLGAYSTQADNIRIYVNGGELKVRDGVASFQRRYNTPGKKTYAVKILATNSFTKQEKEYNKEFRLNVLPPCWE